MNVWSCKRCGGIERCVSGACKDCSMEYNRKYRQSDKYKEYQKKYNQSDKAKDRRKRYINSDKGKETIRKQQQTDKYKEYHKKYNQSDKAKENRRKYQKTDKFKQAQKRFHILHPKKQEEYAKNSQAKKMYVQMDKMGFSLETQKAMMLDGECLETRMSDLKRKVRVEK